MRSIPMLRTPTLTKLKVIKIGPTEVLCVLCERLTSWPMPWQGGASSCCRHCFRARRKLRG
jgi:hypothetical protein